MLVKEMADVVISIGIFATGLIVIGGAVVIFILISSKNK